MLDVRRLVVTDMVASEFNKLVAEYIETPLVGVGFRHVRRDFFLVRNGSVLALLDTPTKWSHLTQSRRWLLCARHDFLRTLEMEVPLVMLHNPSEYPFKVRPTSLSPEYLLSWRYVPLNLGHWDTDEISYGELTDPSAFLTDMADRVVRYGVPWLEQLTPARVLRELRLNGHDAYCERIWIEDYEQHLQAPSN